MNDQQIDLSNLEQRAQSELNAEHYKEAIELYKQLWENSDDEKWRQQLAYCYLQRALSFGQRGMLREAFVLWDSYIQYVEPPYQAYDHYISWQIQSQDNKNVQSGLKQLTVEQIDKQYPELASLFGCLILSGNVEFQEYLPKDSTFIVHLKLAQVALQAYLDNNQSLLKDSLKQLPYRSAFKDFRLLLNVAQNFPQSIEQVLKKESGSSPYFQAFNLLNILTLQGAKLVRQLGRCNYAQGKLVTNIKGFNHQQQQLIDALIQYPEELTDKVKFDLLAQYSVLWGAGEAESICKTLLVNYPAGHKDFNKRFTALDNFETHRLKALASEQNHGEVKAGEYWRKAIEALAQYGDKSENSLKIALILRRMAGLQSDLDRANDLIIESLDYDEDLPSYLHILHYLSQYQVDRVEHKQWLQRSLEAFPQSTKLLTLAIQFETESKECEKASQYASQILAIDPLNTLAKDMLFSSYLDQSRQLIKAKKYPLVEQQIQQAEGLHLGQKYRAQASLVRGLYYFAKQDEKQGLILVGESLAKLHEDPVNTCLQAAMEALLIELPVASILQPLEYVDEYLLSEQQLDAVIQQLNHYGKDFDHQLILLRAVEKISKSLKESLSQQTYAETLILRLAKELDNINAFELLLNCAELAEGKWNTVIWSYYRIYAEQKGMADKCSSAQINRLESLREQAIKDENSRVKLLIDVFIEQYYQAHADTSKGFVDNLFNLNEEIDNDDYLDPSDELFRHIPEDSLLKIMNKTDELMMETTPEQLVEEVAAGRNNEHILLAMMQEPELFSTLMVLKAANSLNIEINLTVNDVLDFFDVIYDS